MRAMTCYDIFMSNFSNLVADYHSFIVGAGMMCIVGRMEGLEFFEDEFLNSLAYQMSVTTKYYVVLSMDKAIQECIRVSRAKFLALVEDDLTIPTPIDHIHVLLDRARLVRPELFGNSDGLCRSSPMGVLYPMQSLLEIAYMDIACLRVPYGCLASSIFAYIYGAHFTPEEMKLVTGFDYKQLSHLTGLFDDLYMRFSIPPVLASENPDDDLELEGYEGREINTKRDFYCHEGDIIGKRDKHDDAKYGAGMVDDEFL